VASKRVVVLASDSVQRLQLASLLASVGGIDLVEPGAAPPPDAWIVHADTPLPPGVAPHVPVIQIGGSLAAAEPRALWLRQPSAALLEAALRELCGEHESADAARLPKLAWQRKSDMIIGRSPAICDLLRQLDRLAPSSASVLVMGESGTGKELVARMLHDCGPRAQAAFVAINCAAIPESLFEAELFGHEKGAFTGADAARVGAFEAAHNGTLFLDEIGELPRPMQAKLLRVLETGEVGRLGARSIRKISVRVVAATNRDLQVEVGEGRFREDLYYRIGVYPIRVPPLRDRPEDVPAVAQHHLALIATRLRRRIPRVTSAALEKLLAYRWPGNIRELINVLERAMLVGDENCIDAHQIALPAPIVEDAGVRSYREAKLAFERAYFSQLMRVAGGNVSLAAKLAQKTRKEIYDALRRNGEMVTAYRFDEPERD
jgi:DNA-binding NtrC family response regulator